MSFLPVSVTLIAISIFGAASTALRRLDTRIFLRLSGCSFRISYHFLRQTGPHRPERMHFLKQLRFVAALLAAFFVLSLTACGSGSNSFTWFVDSIPANLDPQVASSASDIIACENLYSGLVRRTPDGSLAPELCERWEVSADRLTYTFYFEGRSDLYRLEGRSLRLRHHRRGLRLRVPADVPPRHQLPLRRGVLCPREQRRRSGRSEARQRAGRHRCGAAETGVPTLLARRDVPLQADAARRDALRRSVF